MNRPDSGLTMENRAPKASRKVVTGAPWSRRGTSAGGAFLLPETMAVGSDEVESVDAAQLRYFHEGQALEGRFVLQGMQGDPFEQVAEGEVEVFGQSFQHLEQALLEAYAGLDSFDFARRRWWNDFLGGHGGFRV